MRLTAHLAFDGQCRSAFEMYQRIFGGTVRTMLSYGESPLAAQTEPQWHHLILHATLQIDEVELTGVDMVPSDYRVPQGFFVTVGVDEASHGERIFDALASGGRVQLPFQKTFWSPGFGVVVDRYRVPWEINTGVTIRRSRSMEMKQVRQQLQVVDSDLKDSRFFDVNLSNASFTNVSLKRSTFNDVNLSESTFADINLSNVTVTDSNLSGMTINGVLVADLIKAYESRRGDQ
ncbi:MAG TPA: pentapeptide repeat-containing protein [Steroidobacteraceae bacterium]|jgi:PhnB protein|nr:pentapeptide repeat-containing protein [Steroidobacteraceae bacterium]